jgi:replicative DNA helicase
MALVPALDLRPAGDPRDRGPDEPSSVEAEQALLGAILYEPRALKLVTVELLPDHFFEPFHGRLWRAIGEYVRDGDAPEPTLLAEEFRTDRAYQELGGVRYLADLVDRAPPAVRAGDYARHVLDLFHKRRLIAHYAEQTIALRAGDQNALHVVAQTEAELSRIRVASAEPGAFVTARDAARAALAEIEDQHGRQRSRGVYTDLTCFDERMGGLMPTWLVTIGGRPSMGKTALMRAGMYGAALHNPDRTFAAFSLETPNRELSERAIAAGTVVGKSPWDARDEQDAGLITPYAFLGRSTLSLGMIEMPALRASVEAQPENLYLFDAPTLGLGEVRRTVWALKAKGNLAAVSIDYLQLMRREEVRGRNDAALIGDITVGLKQLAMEAQICILLVSQLNRAVDSREDKRPLLSDLRESGSIEQDSNAVLFPFRKAYYLERAKPDGSKEAPEFKDWEMKMRECEHLMEVITAKLRQGKIGADKQQYLAAFDAVSNWRE